MTEQEYEQKKRECFNGFCKRYRIEEPSEQNIESFDWIFDHAYALGKQEKDADTVIQGWVARDDGERWHERELPKPSRKETTMTKYYFMSYMFDAADGRHMASCTCKAENPTLKGLRNLIAKHNDADAETVVIISIKDLTKKEYEMLNNDNDD